MQKRFTSFKKATRVQRTSFAKEPLGRGSQGNKNASEADYQGNCLLSPRLSKGNLQREGLESKTDACSTKGSPPTGKKCLA